jgi:hypothetical protein
MPSSTVMPGGDELTLDAVRDADTDRSKQRPGTNAVKVLATALAGGGETGSDADHVLPRSHREEPVRQVRPKMREVVDEPRSASTTTISSPLRVAVRG